jgi:hypothetical protein
MEPTTTPPLSAPSVDIAFDCLPLRSVSRFDAPLYASDTLRRRAERMKAAVEALGAERSYFLYNTRCLFRFANSEVEGICRFEFEGTVQTDAGDRKCDRTLLDVRLVSETCGGVPSEVEAWLADRVRQAVAVEFDRFIATVQAGAGFPATESRDLSELGGPGGMGV